MADPLCCYPSAYAVARGLRSPVALRWWPTPATAVSVGPATAVSAGPRGGICPAVACLAPSAKGGARHTRLTGCQPAGHDRSMNGTNDHKQLIRPREGRMV